VTLKCDRLLSGQELKKQEKYSVAPPVKRQRLAGNILIKKSQEMGRSAKVTDHNRCTACSQRNDRSPEGGSLGNVKKEAEAHSQRAFMLRLSGAPVKAFPSVGLQIKRVGRLHRPSGAKAVRMAGDSHFRRFTPADIVG
jgi:hypothetical protein